MPRIKVKLSIGYPTAQHDDVLDIDDDEYNACATDDEKEALCDEYCQEWANNYIEYYYEVLT